MIHTIASVKISGWPADEVEIEVIERKGRGRSKNPAQA
jgi:hypothetical protein